MVNIRKCPVTTDGANIIRMIEPLYDLNNLYKAFQTVKKVSGWKEGTQRYGEDLLLNLTDLKGRLENWKYKPKEPDRFTLHERGKVRLIESYSIEDRIVQRCFTEYVLMPFIRPKLIYDNDASLEHRGTDHFRNRLEYKLRRYSKEHGNDGYILLCDFSKFFDNIWHSTLLKCLREFGADGDVLRFTAIILKSHEIDVSYMTDEQYSQCMFVPFNSLEYYRHINELVLDGTKMMPKSVGIGSHLAQLAGAVVPYRLDNYIKIVRGIRDYARYNDDFYIIHESKDFLKELLEEIIAICADLGIIINKKKTQIVPLRHRFSILQTIYFIKDDGFVVEIPCKTGYRRTRKRIKKYSVKVRNGEMTFDKAQAMYKSWRNSVTRRHGTKRSMDSMDARFDELFGKPYNYFEQKKKPTKYELFSW